MGAAWTSVIAQLAINGSLWSKAKKITPFKVFQSLGATIKSTLVMAAGVVVGNALGIPFVVVLVIAILAYLGALIFFKDQTLFDLKSLISGIKHDSQS